MKATARASRKNVERGPQPRAIKNSAIPNPLTAVDRWWRFRAKNGSLSFCRLPE
jgi:hypothetical protein